MVPCVALFEACCQTYPFFLPGFTECGNFASFDFKYDVVKRVWIWKKK